MKNFFPAEFTMNYGVVNGNKAVYRASEGDGGCGGGIYVGSVPYTLHMYDAVITENTAELLGGGL